jgi:hypothetical protein
MNNQGGKRHYEFLLAVIAISLAALVFFVWAGKLAVKVEQAKIQYTLSNISSVIKVRELTAVVAGRQGELIDYHQTNPMDFFDATSPEYAGELNEGDELKTGSWFFDNRTRELVYAAISVESNPGKAKQLRYQLQYIDSVGAGRGSLRLVPVPYQAKEAENE